MATGIVREVTVCGVVFWVDLSDNTVKAWDEVAGHFSRTAPVSQWYRTRALAAARRAA